MRAIFAFHYRSVSRKKNHVLQRRSHRIWQHVFQRNGAICYNSVEAAWTDRLSEHKNKKKMNVKEAVHNSTSGIFLLVSYWNIESMRRSGILGEILEYMRKMNLKIMFLQETKCPGDDTYRSGEFYIINCGRNGREPYGVAVIVHFSLIKHVVGIRGVSERIIYVQLKKLLEAFSVLLECMLLMRGDLWTKKKLSMRN